MPTKRSAARARTPGVLRIATRSSELALRQARLVHDALGARRTAAELVTFKTTGDKKLDEPLGAIGAKGLFTKELEDALRAGKVDCCVHSLKDLPTDMPDELSIVAVLEREDPRDVLVVNDGIAAEGLDDLPRGSRVGTSSLRRRAQLLGARPDLDVVELRGNVPTRLKKVDDGKVHAAILAAAGLRRLGVQQRIDAWLEPPAWLPAAGQGAIAVQVRADDARIIELLSPLDHAATSVAVRAERAFLSALDGGCQVPIGALVTTSVTGLVLYGLIADAHGTRIIRGEEPVDANAPERAAERLAAELLRRGGDFVLAQLRNLEKVPAPQPE
ncbi:MAG TPA: hydroxymethylbilane synthase [Gemmatimonadaceae bacterium]|nr:hydroxymethylbilane synthase [Gemmatimonadaceae bacterium]